jgi:alcohol-forming fatty acyl-CoA reductase
MTPANGIGAFFDVDGTLLPAPSLEWRFVSWLAACDLLNGWHIASWAATAIPALLCGELSSRRTNKKYLAGLPESLIQTWESSLDKDSLATFSEAAQRIAWHLDQNHRVLLVSGTLAPLAQILARRLNNQIEIRATHLEVIEGLYSGFIEENHMSGSEKARALAQIANHHSLALADSYAYGNHPDDLPMLEAVGNPIAVNPGLRLKRIAAQRHWRIARWQSPQRSTSKVVPSTHAFTPHEERN